MEVEEGVEGVVGALRAAARCMNFRLRVEEDKDDMMG